MRPQTVTGRMYKLMTGGLMLASLLCVSSLCPAEAGDDAVERAYQMKMNGQAGAAVPILQESLAADSTNAAAWFELARIKQQIGLGDPRKLMAGLEDLMRAADHAATYDPDNMTFAYYRAYVCFFRAYASFVQGQSDAVDKVAEVIAAYEGVLAMDPDYHEARLFLVEILSAPSEMGGDADKAEAHVAELEERHPFMGAMGRDLVMAEDADRIDYWQALLELNSNSADVMEQLGKAYLYQGMTNEGIGQLEAAMKADAEKQGLLLDIAKYYLMMFRQDRTQGETVLPKAKEAINRYLKTDPIRPFKAYALHTLGRIEKNLGLEQAAEARFAEAQEQDPHLSKAFATPPAILFTKLDEVTHYHRYFSRPF